MSRLDNTIKLINVFLLLQVEIVIWIPFTVAPSGEKIDNQFTVFIFLR